LNKNVNSIKSIPFGNFSDKIIEYAATTFSPIYARVVKKHWDNSRFARVRKNYYFSSFEDGIVEVYIPTFQHESLNMNYHRIIIKTLPYLDKEIMLEESQILQKRKYVSHGRGPAGTIDSTTIVLMARQISPSALIQYREDKKLIYYGQKPKREWFLRGKKRQGNLMIMPIITKVPEIAIKRLLTVLMKFYKDRLKALVKSLYLMRFHYEERSTMSSALYYITSCIREKISLSLGNAVSCLSRVYDWFREKKLQIIGHLARQTQIMNLFKQISKVKPLIREIQRQNNPYKLDVDPELLTQLVQILQVR